MSEFMNSTSSWASAADPWLLLLWEDIHVIQSRVLQWQEAATAMGSLSFNRNHRETPRKNKLCKKIGNKSNTRVTSNAVVMSAACSQVLWSLISDWFLWILHPEIKWKALSNIAPATSSFFPACCRATHLYVLCEVVWALEWSGTWEKAVKSLNPGGREYTQTSTSGLCFVLCFVLRRALGTGPRDISLSGGWGEQNSGETKEGVSPDP